MIMFRVVVSAMKSSTISPMGSGVITGVCKKQRSELYLLIQNYFPCEVENVQILLIMEGISPCFFRFFPHYTLRIIFIFYPVKFEVEMNQLNINKLAFKLQFCTEVTWLDTYNPALTAFHLS